MANGSNLEADYGWFVDGIVKFVDENPDEFLEHHGVKGMRWGHRKEESTGTALVGLGPDRITKKTKSGDEITLEKVKPTAIAKGLGKVSSKYRDYYNNGAQLVIKDSSGKRVGSAVVAKKGPDELYLNWLGIDKGSRGKGYATAAMKTAEAYGKKQGFKKMTLEVPGNAPDARHIYEKLGFKVTNEAKSDNDIWGGLTEMEYTFSEAKHEEAPSLVLVHHGVKGMKWGVRRNRSAGVTAAPKQKKAPKPNVKTLSDEELRKHINRLQMEKQYKELSGAKPSSKGKKIAADVLTNSGKTAATTVLTAATVYGLKKAIEKQFGTDVVSDIFPKKKK